MSESLTESAKRLFFRRLLHIFLKDKNIINVPTLRNLRDHHYSSLGVYFATCLQKMNLEFSVSEAELDTLQNTYLHEQAMIKMMWVLRYEVGLVVESLILLDRVLFLAEFKSNARSCGCLYTVWLDSVFDRALSPRNMAILACKIQDGG